MSTEETTKPTITNNDGQVSVCDEDGQEVISVTIPSDISMLNVFGNNTQDIQHKDDFRTDWYQYRNGVRLRKYFSGNRFGMKHFWPPVIEQLARIEAAYHRSRQRKDRLWTKTLAVIKQAFDTLPVHSPDEWKKLGVQAANDAKEGRRVLHTTPHEDRDDRVIYYSVGPSDLVLGEMGYTSSHTYRKPEVLSGVSLGDEILRLDRLRFSRGGGQLYKLLEEALIEKAKSLGVTNKNFSQDYCITVNGRIYWVHGAPNQHSYFVYTVTHMPENTTIFHEHKED